MTVTVAGASSAEAAIGIHTATYAPGTSATTAQMKEDARILALRLDRLDASFVHVAVSHGDIILSSADRSISHSLLNGIGQTARMYFRPVLCFADLETAPNGSTATTIPSGYETIPACNASSELTEANLDVTPNSSPQGYSSHNVAPDDQYTAYSSTSVDVPNYANSTVLLPGLAASGSTDDGDRYVLGPAEMTGDSISSAKATKDQTGAWVVDYNLAGSAGSALWDKVAQENFHQLLGIELDGIVYSAPIIQPTQSSFSSFDGKGEISGNLTKTEAQQLALAMNSGALPIALRLETVQP
jgi:preprotein translocase subunit SecD